MKRTAPHTTLIRFRQWSRKGYAIFCSLGRQVTIGCLSKKVADCSLTKQQGSSHSILHDGLSKNKLTEEFTDKDHPPKENGIVLNSSALLPIWIINRATASCTTKANGSFRLNIVLPHNICKQEYFLYMGTLVCRCFFYTN